MKNLFLSLVLVMVGLVSNSQVITVTFTKCQNFTHPSNISLVEAMNSNLIEYPYHTEGKNVFTFDFNTKVLTIENSDGVYFYTIDNVTKNNNVVDCVIVYEGVETIFLLGKTSDNQSQFLMGRDEENQMVGFFSMNSDFNYTIK